MVLHTYQVSIYQGRIKGTSKKRVTAKIIQKIQYMWALDIHLLYLYWPIFIYIAIYQEAFASMSFFYKFTSTLKEYTAAKSIQSCPTLCNPIDGSPPGSLVPGILQAKTPEWAAISFSNACKWKVKVKLLSRVRFLATPWTAAYQAPPSMGFSRQEYWSGVPLPSPKEYTKYSKITSHSKATLENEIILPRAYWKTLQCYTERTHSHQFAYVQVWDFFSLIVWTLFASRFLQLNCQKTPLRKSRSLNMVK